MTTEVKDVTPKIAREMLSMNEINRNLNDRHVLFLSKEMKNGNWMFDGSPIKFSKDGLLLDGQHRLSAIIRSNTTQKFLIVIGISNDAFKVMDTGKLRSSADALNIKGVPSYTTVAACAKFILNNQKGRRWAGGDEKTSTTEIITWYENNKEIIELIKDGSRLQSLFSNIMTKAPIASWLYLFGEVDSKDASLFMNKLCTGLDLEINSPIFLLRKRLTEDKINKYKIPMKDKTALMIKAWNYHRLGKTPKFLRFSRNTETFPVIK
ncbi:MAG: hypothetical protein COA36_16845 [Desulfotalea sp.]|nr:MAG: hypothetical protein COA36_16845 [Desulfotalea sp.]